LRKICSTPQKQPAANVATSGDWAEPVDMDVLYREAEKPVRERDKALRWASMAAIYTIAQG